MSKKDFTMRVVRNWHRWLREVMDDPALECSRTGQPDLAENVPASCRRMD